MQITVEGHEPNGEPGSAIVCASASTIMQPVALGALMSLAKTYPDKVEVVEDETPLPRCTQCQHPVQVHNEQRGCTWCVCGQRHP